MMQPSAREVEFDAALDLALAQAVAAHGRYSELGQSHAAGAPET